MQKIECRTLHGVDENELLRVFNESFANYFVTVQLTIEDLRVMITADHIDLDLSAGAFTDNKLVGFILHAFDCIDGKNTVYNAGTGVVPEYRGQGITKRMYNFILPALRERKIDVVLLEVITQNAPAIKVYESVGFTVERKLPCYKGKLSAVSNPDVKIKALAQYDWVKLKSFWDFIPTWQNSVLVLEELKETNKLFGAFVGDELAGYLVYNPQSKRVQQFAVNAEYRRRKIASTLFEYVTKMQEEEFKVINVDGRDVGVNEFLKRVGMEVYVEQVGMRLRIRNKSR